MRNGNTPVIKDHLVLLPTYEAKTWTSTRDNIDNSEQISEVYNVKYCLEKGKNSAGCC